MKKISRGHRRDRRVKEFAAKCRLWHSYGRFKSSSIPESLRSAVSLDLLLVNLQNFIQRQEHRLHEGSSRELNLPASGTRSHIACAPTPVPHRTSCAAPKASPER